MQGPARSAPRLFLRVPCAANNLDRWDKVSLPDQEQVHLLHTTKAVGSPQLSVPQQKHKPMCVQLRVDTLYHPCGPWEQGGT